MTDPIADRMKKYLPSTDSQPTYRTHWLVELADTSVRIEEVLRLFDVHIPEGAGSWKAFCPFSEEHEDGGVDRALRVFSESNSCMCFALHGPMTPSQVWEIHTGKSRVQASEALLERFGIPTRRPTYQERVERLMAEHSKPTPIDRTEIWEGMNAHLRNDENYLKHQYDKNVLHVVKLIQTDINNLPDEMQSEELDKWFSQRMGSVAQLLTFLKSKNG